MKRLTMIIEWIRPIGIVLVFLLGEAQSSDPVSKLHILAPFIILIMCGTVAFESIFLGKAASEKIGYAPSRAYQLQSGLANLAIAITALIVYFLDWGKFADATILIVMLMFFTLSAVNHTVTIIKNRNTKFANLMRPVLTILLLAYLVPILIHALAG